MSMSCNSSSTRRGAAAVRRHAEARVDFTWNNLYIVKIWTNEPATLTMEVKSTLDRNSGVVLLALLLLILAGSACGGVAILKCARIKRDIHRHHRCCTTFLVNPYPQDRHL